MTKIKLIIAMLFLAGCKTPKHIYPHPQSPPPPAKSFPSGCTPNPGQPFIIDPIGDNSIPQQSHFYPFVWISLLVLGICFIPYLYMSLSPHFPVVKQKSLKWLTDLKNKFKKKKD